MNSCRDISNGMNLFVCYFVVYVDDEERGRGMIVYVCTVALLTDSHFVPFLLCYLFYFVTLLLMMKRRGGE